VNDTVPFVLSEDIYPLMNVWARNQNRKIPSIDYFKDNTQHIVENLCAIFPRVQLIETRNLMEHFNTNINQNDCVVSLDRAYAPLLPRAKIFYSDTCRALNVKNEPMRYMRPEYLPEDSTQIPKDRSLILLDDVIFDGRTLAHQITTYGKERIEKIVTGIATEKGKNFIEQQFDIPVQSAYVFHDLIDEVCERDFIPGTPLCGKPVYHSIDMPFFMGSRPYIAPFGDAEKWASIPQNHILSFSENCMALACDMWDRIGEMNNITLRNQHLPRPVYGVDQQALPRNFNIHTQQGVSYA
jgi:hypothetical protein